MSDIRDYGNISFERIPECWLVRGHTDGGGFGSEYEWAFVLIPDGEKGIAKGMISDNMLVSEDVKTIRKFLEDNGLKCVEYTRNRKQFKTKHRLK